MSSRSAAGSALGLGPRGREFESRRLDHFDLHPMTLRILFLIPMILSGCTKNGVSASSEAAVPTRALWVSTEGEAVVQNPSARALFFTHIQTKAINRIFVNAAQLSSAAHRLEMSSLVSDCRSRGIDVEFLYNVSLGSATISDGGLAAATAGGAAKLYQQTYCATGGEGTCGSAFHVDYEPHTTPEWSNRAQAISDYLAGLGLVKAALTGSGLKLSVDAGHYYGNAENFVNGVGLIPRMLGAGVDRIYIMNYTNSETLMRSRIENEISQVCAFNASTVGAKREIYNGTDAKIDPTPGLSFASLGWQAMDHAWSTMNQEWVSSECFKGNAGFDSDDVQALGP